MNKSILRIVSLGLMLSLIAVLTHSPLLALQADETPRQDPVSSPSGLVDHAVEMEGTGLWIVRLTDPSLAAYGGSIAGLAPTSPQITGERKLDINAPASVAYRNYLQDKQNEFTAVMNQTLGRSVDIQFQYLNVINGLAVRVTPEEAAVLANLPGVAAVYRDTVRELDTDVSHDLILSASIWDGETGNGVATRGEGIIVGMLDTGVNPGHPSFAATDGDGYTHTNPFGSGNFIGVCDPAHPNHEDICNDKLIGAWNFHPASPSAQDWNNHGSHVGSTIAGNKHDAVFTVGPDVFTREIQGVAPRANVISYLVCFPTCPASSSVAAVNQAIADGTDVLNYSISGVDNPWNDIVDLAFLEGFNAGIFIAASAGNDGPGPSTVAKTGPWNASVAASTHNRIIANTMDVTGPAPVPPTLEDIGAVPGTGPAIVADIEGEIRYAGLVDPGNERGCNPFPAGLFAGAIALIQRGDCTFAVKVNNATAAGAIAVVVFNHLGGPPITMGGLEPTVIPAVFIDRGNGNELRDFIIANSPTPTTARINAGASVVTNDDWQDIMAGFSSRGPSQFEMLAPTFTAPGVNILAAGMEVGGDPNQYVFLQGTSMASPHGAGSGALLVALHPDWSPAEIRAALASTADNDGILKEDAETAADPFDMGSGRLNLDKAGRVGLVLDETYDNFVAANPAIGGDPKTLNLPAMVNRECVGSCNWTRTVESVADVSATYTAVAEAPPGMVVTVNPATFTLDLGATQEVEITANISGLPGGVWAFAEVRFETVAQHPGGQPIAPVHYPIAVIPVPEAPETPVITLDPEEITSVQGPGEIVVETLTIGNIGGADLLWELFEDGPEIGPLGRTTPVTTVARPQAITIGDTTLSGSHNMEAEAGAVHFPQAPPTPDSSVTLTHSASQAIVAGNSVACSPDGGFTTTENGFLRTFTLEDFGILSNFDVTQVSFGIENLTGVAQTLTVNLFTLDAMPFTYANMTLIGSASATFNPQSLTIVDIAVTGNAPAGSTLVVEVDAPHGNNVGGFWIGSNSAGQTAPSYIRSASCGLAEPTDLAVIGFANMHIVMNVTGFTDAPACNVPGGTPWADVTPTSGTVPPGGEQEVSVIFDSTGIAAGTHTANLCIESNDPDRPLAVVPLTLVVEEPVEAPEIQVSPESMEATQPANTVTNQTLTISNVGEGLLEWDIEEAEAGPEGMIASTAVTLYDNGPLVTHPGAGPGGADHSTVQNLSMGLILLGANVSSPNFRITDDFTVTESGGWDVDAITFYSYQTGSSTSSTFNHVNYQIWDGPPNETGSNVVFGDTTTNRLVSTDWTNIYRVSETTVDTQRPIMYIVASGGFHLEPGSYWVDWQLGGTLASGPWQPPVTILGQTTTGNAKQFATGAWQNLLDGGTGTPQGAPFTIEGSLADPHPCDTPTDIPWLSVSPTSGTTPAGGSSEVTVTFDATSLDAGSYHAQLCINSNDPFNPLVTVPVTLTVTDDADLYQTLVNAGGDTYTDADGNVWVPDQVYTPGDWGYINSRATAHSTTQPIAGTADQPLFQTARQNPMEYRFDGLPPGTYEIRLGFAEILNQQPGARVFDVLIQNQVVLANYDITASVGRFHADEYIFHVEVTGGQLSIRLRGHRGSAPPIINAIGVTQQP